MKKSDGKLHREVSANKNRFRTSAVKNPHKPKGSKGFIFDKAGNKKYVHSPIIVHAKKK
jgi:hypothetical protein